MLLVHLSWQNVLFTFLFQLQATLHTYDVSSQFFRTLLQHGKSCFKNCALARDFSCQVLLFLSWLIFMWPDNSHQTLTIKITWLLLLFLTYLWVFLWGSNLFHWCNTHKSKKVTRKKHTYKTSRLTQWEETQQTADDVLLRWENSSSVTLALFA